MAHTQHPEHQEEDPRFARAFRAFFCADVRSSAEKGRNRVSQVLQAFLDAGFGLWGRDQVAVEQTERWAVDVRS
ncbi:hypothetical protein N7463_007838 [Penicillium fimorum]|uniref:Uncharacterized protein n=1 Tax=Penicillium fimorum TaxID=1882269 RepID=A0A9X0C7C5_9EURO|nr:hypothetical protein N7463_007838 [Penicillium fimorum]